MSDIKTLAAEAGLLDMDALRLAPPHLSPADQIANLRARFPTAFQKHARDMNAEEFAALERRLLNPPPPSLPDFGDLRNASPEEVDRAAIAMGLRVSAGAYYRSKGVRV